MNTIAPPILQKDQRVKVSFLFPPDKARINGLCVGDQGKVLTVYRTRTGAGIAMVEWDKGFRTTANECDLERVW
jgi:hypothetical protein